MLWSNQLLIKLLCLLPVVVCAVHQTFLTLPCKHMVSCSSLPTLIWDNAIRLTLTNERKEQWQVSFLVWWPKNNVSFPLLYWLCQVTSYLNFPRTERFPRTQEFRTKDQNNTRNTSGLTGFIGSRVFSAKTGKYPKKWEQVGYPMVLEENIWLKFPLALIP